MNDSLLKKANYIPDSFSFSNASSPLFFLSFLCVCVYVYMCVCVYMCMCVCVCMYTVVDDYLDF
jgi:hypothetical protein